MRPVTRYLSKPMLPIGGTPVIDWIVREAGLAGCEPIVVIGRPDDTALKDFVDRHDLSTSIEWTTQPEPRGLADAVLKGYELLPDGPVAMMLPDNVILRGDGVADLLEPDFKEDVLAWGKTMVSRESAHYFGNSGDYEPETRRPDGVETVVGLQEKQDGTFIDRGLDWPAPRLIGRVKLPHQFFERTRRATPDSETGEIDDVPIFRRLIDSAPGKAVPVSGEVCDMGEPESYLRLTSDYFQREAKRHD